MSAADGLCVSCGLCCDGTLFDRAKTSPEEAPRIAAYGLDVHPDQAHFTLPCPLLDGTACSIYADRFDICRTFRCKLLRSVDTGDVSRDRADALITEAKRLRDVAERTDPAAGRVAVRWARVVELSDWTTRADPDERRRAATAYLALAAAERFFNAHFREPAKGSAKSGLAPADASGAAGV